MLDDRKKLEAEVEELTQRFGEEMGQLEGECESYR